MATGSGWPEAVCAALQVNAILRLPAVWLARVLPVITAFDTGDLEQGPECLWVRGWGAGCWGGARADSPLWAGTAKASLEEDAGFNNLRAGSSALSAAAGSPNSSVPVGLFSCGCHSVSLGWAVRGCFNTSIATPCCRRSRNSCVIRGIGYWAPSS